MIVKKAYHMAKSMNVPILGIVENYSYLVSGVEEELLVQPTRRASIVKRHNEVRMRCFLLFIQV